MWLVELGFESDLFEPNKLLTSPLRAQERKCSTPLYLAFWVANGLGNLRSQRKKGPLGGTARGWSHGAFSAQIQYVYTNSPLGSMWWSLTRCLALSPSSAPHRECDLKYRSSSVTPQLKAFYWPLTALDTKSQIISEMLIFSKKFHYIALLCTLSASMPLSWPSWGCLSQILCNSLQTSPILPSPG